MNITAEQLEDIIAKHEKWVKGIDGGERANLRDANLCGANLRSANLSDANLCGVNLSDVDLCGADLRGANLYGANLCSADLYCTDLHGANLYSTNLRGADLHSANLSGADLRGAGLRGTDLSHANLHSANLYNADLSGVDLHGANLYCADLRNANLSGADLSDADLRSANLHGADLRGIYLNCTDLSGIENIPFIPTSCPDTGTFMAWKKARGYIVKLQIPETAKRSSSTGRKCRCNEAMVLAIENLDGTASELTEIESSYDGDFVYKVGETVKVNNFCEDRFTECAPGIHFFINRQEAVNYNQL